MRTEPTTSGPVDGLVVVDKPGGMTSHDVVGRVRRLAGTRKVGHAGTLDPMATGVLVLGVGRATRLLGHLVLASKGYDATIRLGASTVTDDAEGAVVSVGDASGLSPALIGSALAGFVGPLRQVPSAVSAVKVDGRRAYDRVRAGEAVALEPREVVVHSLDVGDIRVVDTFVDVDVRLCCSSGTYVRAIARDLGAGLGVGGHLTALRRTAVGPFDLTSARTLESLTSSFSVLPLAAAARRCFASVDLTGAQADDVRYGRSLDLSLAPGPHAVFAPDGEFLALYGERDGRARALAVFVG